MKPFFLIIYGKLKKKLTDLLDNENSKLVRKSFMMSSIYSKIKDIQVKL